MERIDSKQLHIEKGVTYSLQAIVTLFSLRPELIFFLIKVSLMILDLPYLFLGGKAVDALVCDVWLDIHVGIVEHATVLGHVVIKVCGLQHRFRL